MTVRITSDVQLVSITNEASARITRATQLVSRQYLADVRLGRVSMLILRSILDGPPEPPPDPPVEPPSPPPAAARASLLRRSDIIAVLNEFGLKMVDELSRYADVDDSGFGTRTIPIDMNGHKIVNSGATQAGFDAISLQEVQSLLP